MAEGGEARSAGRSTTGTQSRNQGRIALRRIYGALLVALIAAPALAIGGVHDLTRNVIGFACCVALALALGERAASGKRVTITVPMTLVAACAFTALQLVPLPAVLVHLLSPAADDLFRTVLGAYDRHALTLDPAGTADELAKLGAYFAFFAAASIYASRSARRQHLVYAVTATATLIALIGLVEATLGTQKLLWFYTPSAHSDAIVRGTFVNANHFGALMCLGAPCALAIGLTQPRLRWAAFSACIILNVAVVLSLSRASIVAALFGQGLTFAFDRLQARSSSDESGASGVKAAMLVAIVAAAAVGASFGASKLRAKIEHTTKGYELERFNGKIYAWEKAGSLVWSYPWTGTGRGAFEQAFTRAYDRGGELRHRWVENGYLQAVIDWGAPAAILLLTLSGWALVLAMRRLREDNLAIGAMGALVALAAHEAFDFSIEYAGVALPALALLAALFGRRDDAPGQLRMTARWWMLVAPAAVAAALVMHLGMPSAGAEADALARLARDPSVPTATVVSAGQATRARHPADYFVYAVVGERLAHARDPAAMGWLNRAIFLNPSHPAAHLLAAELLAASAHANARKNPKVAASQRSQSLLEYRTAVAASGAPEQVWERVSKRYPAVANLLAATPDNLPTLQALAVWLTTQARSPAAEAVCEHMLTVNDKDIWTWQELVQLAIVRHDGDTAKARAKTLQALDHSEISMHLVGWAAVAAGDRTGLAALLDGGIAHSDETFQLELALAHALLDHGEHDQARGRLDRLEQGWALDRDARIKLHMARAEVEQKAGNQHQYDWEVEQAQRLQSP